MTSPKISVIIPIHNVEKYLDKCLSSVRNQTLKKIEIICVDDCSPDDSYLIAERHAAEDSRIRLIRHKKNLGLGGARNTAIRMAKAEYIASVDSDDFILPEMMEKLWSATDDGLFDVVCCGFNRVDEKGNIISYETYSANVLINENNSINIFSALNPAFWNKIWRKSLFTDNEIFFPIKDYFEDMPTTPRILAKVKQIKIIEDRPYQYFVRSKSISNSYSAKHIIDYFKGFEILLTFLEDNNLLERYQKEFINYVNGGIRFHSEQVIGSGMDKSELEQYFRHFLMLKISFFENRDLFKLKNIGELLELLKQTNVTSHNTQLLNDNSKYKDALSVLEVENSKILEKGLNYQDELVTKEQENQELSVETIKSKEALNLIKLENEHLLDEISKYKDLLSTLKRENIEYKDLLNTSKWENANIQGKYTEYKNRLLEMEKNKEKAISCGQSIGVSLFGSLFRLTMTKAQYIKLKEEPKMFFKDSRSSFTRVIGSILNLL